MQHAVNVFKDLLRDAGKQESREEQENDVSRLERIKDWFKENWLGASSLAARLTGLITTIIIGARTAAVKGVQATKSFVQAARDAIKKLGPWALPLSAFLYWVLKGGATALSWLSMNLWVAVLIAVAIAYYYFRRRD